MASKNYHSRKLHEQLFQRLVKESKLPLLPHEKCLSKMSDYQLLWAIDCKLRAMECIGYTYDELEMELL